MIQKTKTALSIWFALGMALSVSGCGITGGGSSNDGSSNQPVSGVQQGGSSNGGGSPAVQSFPPPASQPADPQARLEAYRRQVENAGPNSARVLYDGLGSSDLAIRKFAEEWLTILIEAQPEAKQEVEEMQKKLVNPESWPYAKEFLVKLENSKSTANSDNGQY